jgi:hypothetical protein
MEIHPPTKPIRSVKEFLLHLLTITIGVSIALSLDGIVEARHHRRLLHEARASLQMEIRANRDGLESAMKDVAITQEQLKKILSVPKTPSGAVTRPRIHLGCLTIAPGPSLCLYCRRAGGRLARWKCRSGAMTVSGLTITSAPRQSAQARESQAQRTRSAGRNLGRAQVRW